MTFLRVVVCIALCAGVVSCSALNMGGASGSSEEAGRVVAIDDRASQGKLNARLKELASSGAAVDSDKLGVQLKERKRYPIDLPSCSRRRLTMAQVANRCRDGVLVLGYNYLCGKCDKVHTGQVGGFVVHESGVAVTNYHVMADKEHKAMAAMTADGRIHPVKEILAADKDSDVAVFRIEGDGFTPLPLAADEPVGAPVVAISHPANRLYSVTSGIVSRYFVQRKGGAKVERMAVTAEYARGSSGSPILNDRGAVVGMVASTTTIHYNTTGDTPKSVQMVARTCIPAKAILEVLSD